MRTTIKVMGGEHVFRWPVEVGRAKMCSTLAQHRQEGTGNPTKERRRKWRQREKIWPVLGAAEDDAAQESQGQACWESPCVQGEKHPYQG